MRGCGETIAQTTGIDHQHMFSSADQLHGGGQAGEASPDDDCIEFHDRLPFMYLFKLRTFISYGSVRRQVM